MLRIHLMQNWYGLSDAAMENDLIDIACLRRFAGIDLVSDHIAVREHLREQGLLLREGTVVDATIIHAPTSTKNRKRERDLEMHSSRKGNQWFFGMKAHIGVDQSSGLIHSVSTTGANVHDVTMAAELLHGEERVVYGDAGYQGLEKREEMAGREVECRIAMRPGHRRQLAETPEGRLLHWMEWAKAHIRAKVEHPFRVIKQQFGFWKTRLRGLAKNHCKVTVLAALTNLFLARKRLLAMAAA